MTYAASAAKTYGKRPIWLYQIQMGSSSIAGAAIYLALDVSGSMNGARQIYQKAAVMSFLDSLKGSDNSFRIVTWQGEISSSIERLNSSESDIDDLIAFVDAIPDTNISSTGTNFGDAVSEAAQFYTDAETAGVGFLDEVPRRILFFITDGEPFPSSTLAPAVATIATIARVEVFAFNIDLEDITSTSQVDNTAIDGVPVVSSSNPDALREALLVDRDTFLTSQATDFLDPVVPGRIWRASPTRHSRIVQSAEAKKAGVSVILKRTDATAQAIRDDEGLTETRLRIWHTFLDDPDEEVVIKFDGRVVGVKPSLVSITLECETSLAVMRRKGLSAVIQRPCRHAVYHGGCGISRYSFQVLATATALSGSVVTVTEASAQSDGYYAGGILKFRGAMQMIVAHSGTSLRLLGPVAGLKDEIFVNLNAAVQIAPGCDGTMTVCDGRFGNILNYGGFGWIDQNPFDGRRIG